MGVAMVSPKVVEDANIWFPLGGSWPKVIKPEQNTNLPTNSFWFDETVAPIKLNNFHHGTFN
jgi:hypothetical protein